MTQCDIPNKFNSPMALSFFIGKERAKKKIEENKIENYEAEVKSHIYKQIELLQNANMYVDGWKSIIDDRDSRDACSDLQINSIRNKATYIAMFLYLCLQHYENTVDFRDIIGMAIDKVNDVHLVDFLPSKKRSKTNFILRDKRTMINWFHEFRVNDYFSNPAILLKNKKKQLPPLLDSNPDVVEDMLDYC